MLRIKEEADTVSSIFIIIYVLSLSFFFFFFFFSFFFCNLPEKRKLQITRLQEYLFAVHIKMCTGICFGDVPFITVR